ncbi:MULTISPECIES: hypothetical protein [unclassified Mycobacterium]|uniref:hypothetical protein n=1 Tax=unclassified Mycobacterium TaxID=2642494 RepID=UPI0029C7F588|nr:MULTISPECIES: hypothetical protein [unclassified Mycobacterium]
MFAELGGQGAGQVGPGDHRRTRRRLRGECTGAATRLAQERPVLLEARDAVTGLRPDDRLPDSFIPLKPAPAYLQPDNIIGELVHGIEVMGSYGPAWLIETLFVPQDYVAVVASGGLNAQSNVVGVREHPVASYRGLLAVGRNFNVISRRSDLLCCNMSRPMSSGIGLKFVSLF